MARLTPEEDRLAFQLEGLKKIDPKTLVEHIEATSAERSDVVSPSRVNGEFPDRLVPGQVVLSEKDVDPPSPRLQAIIDSVAEHNLKAPEDRRKRIVIMGAASAGVIALGIGTYFAVKYFIDKDPKADITKQEF